MDIVQQEWAATRSKLKLQSDKLMLVANVHQSAGPPQ